MTYEMKKRARDPASLLAARRAEIVAEYRFYNLNPIRICREAISMELALQLGLLVDNSAAVE